MNERNISLSPGAARRLGDAVVRHRVELGYKSARKLGEATNLDYRTITAIEGARRTNVSRTTIAMLEMHLGMSTGALISIAEDLPKQHEEVALIVGPDIDPVAVDMARLVAQAAFDAAIKQMTGRV